MRELLPLMAVPVVRASNLARLAAYYRDVLKFTIVQEAFVQWAINSVFGQVADGSGRPQQSPS